MIPPSTPALTVARSHALVAAEVFRQSGKSGLLGSFRTDALVQTMLAGPTA